MKTNQTKAVLWNSPLTMVARRRRSSPEAWHAECLSEARDQLQVAVRSLEFQGGFDTGRSVGRVELVLATKLDDQEPGAAAVAANPGA